MRKRLLLLTVLTAAWGYAIEAGGTVPAVAPGATTVDFGRLVAGDGAGDYFWGSNETGRRGPAVGRVCAAGRRPPAPNALAAAAWDDLRGISGDHLYSYLDTTGDLDIWVLSYDPWHRYLSVGPFRFQMQIFERPVEGINNTVEFHYQTVLASGINLGQSATVGLENWDGTEAAAYSYTDDLEASFAVRFMDSRYVDDYIP